MEDDGSLTNICTRSWDCTGFNERSGNPDTHQLHQLTGIQGIQTPTNSHQLTESPVVAIRPGIRGRGREAV